MTITNKKRMPRPDETKRKISEKLKGNIPWNKDKKGVQVSWNKGRGGLFKHSEETKKKISLALKGKKKPPFSEEHKKNLSGENHPAWKGGMKGKNLLRKREKIVGRKRPEQCEICGAMGKICFDHDHKTGRFRGWICRRCNTVLGFVKDNRELLLEIVNYLNKLK